MEIISLQTLKDLNTKSNCDILMEFELDYQPANWYTNI